jgi:nicotinamide-nucleotide amidase
LKAEIICIGTELLLGDIVNTNAVYFAKELASIGIDLFYVTTVGDNKERVISVLKNAWNRADIIITSGGLGPTEDDLTHESIAGFLGVEMKFNQEIADKLTSYFKSTGRVMVKSNLKQANFPEQTDVLPNNYGTAPGIIYNKNNKIILTFPGVPSELKSMWELTAKQFLISMNPNVSLITSKDLRFTGEGESAIAEKVSDLLNMSNPTVAPYAGRGEVRLRITAKAENENKALEMIKPVEKEIINRLDKYYYGSGNDNLETVVGKILTDKCQTVAVAESFTGGKLAERIVSVPDASNYFKMGLVAYSTEVKINQLGINKELIKNHSVYSEEVAIEMAKRIRDISNCDWGIGTTGLAGTKDHIHQIDDEEIIISAGTIFVAVASKDKVQVRKLIYSRWKREDIIYLGSQASLNLLRLMILDKI